MLSSYSPSTYSICELSKFSSVELTERICALKSLCGFRMSCKHSSSSASSLAQKSSDMATWQKSFSNSCRVSASSSFNTSSDSAKWIEPPDFQSLSVMSYLFCRSSSVFISRRSMIPSALIKSVMMRAMAAFSVFSCIRKGYIEGKCEIKKSSEKFRRLQNPCSYLSCSFGKICSVFCSN